MFFQECEGLADEFPEIKETIAKIDGILRTTGPGCVLRPEEIASILDERPSQVSAIFEALSKEGLLRKQKYTECMTCGNLIPPQDYRKAVDDQDSFECPQCQSDLIARSPEEVEVYRVSPARIEVSTHKAGPCSIASSSPSEGFEQAIPPKILNDPFSNTPLLHYYSRNRNLLQAKPFSEKRVICILHFLRDLLPFVKTAVVLGLNINNACFFYKDYPYPQREAIGKWLKDQGAIVYPRSYMDQYLRQLTETPSERIGRILIIEDGGFLVPAIHRQFTGLIPNVIGAIEQTTRGIHNSEKWQQEKKENELRFPLISVATSQLKSDFEPSHIAQAVINNIRQLLQNTALNGKAVALFGCGTIGREIANRLKQNEANVTIFEPYPDNRLWAQQRGFTVADSPGAAVENKSFVIGASGMQSINSEVIASLSHGSYVLSASSEQYEIDIDELTRQARHKNALKNHYGEVIGTTFLLPSKDRQIHVLADGYPINFWGFESMPGEASDLILTLILLCSAEVALGEYSEPGISSEAVDQIANKYQVAKKFLEFHKQG